MHYITSSSFNNTTSKYVLYLGLPFHPISVLGSLGEPLPEDLDYEASNEFFKEEESDHELGKVIDTKYSIHQMKASIFYKIALSYNSVRECQ
jgi:hypothetical protein